MRDVGYFLFSEYSSKILFSELDDTSESSTLCQVQKAKGWCTVGRQYKHVMSYIYGSDWGRHVITCTNWNMRLDHIETHTLDHSIFVCLFVCFIEMLGYCLKWENIKYAFMHFSSTICSHVPILCTLANKERFSFPYRTT